MSESRAHSVSMALSEAGESLRPPAASHIPYTQLAATGQTVPSPLKQPTDRPTMRWIFQCFEGISLVRFFPLQHAIAGLEPLHEQVIRLLGLDGQKCYDLAI